jgi:hypothetical protein
MMNILPDLEGKIDHQSQKIGIPGAHERKGKNTETTKMYKRNLPTQSKAKCESRRPRFAVEQKWVGQSACDVASSASSRE